MLDALLVSKPWFDTSEIPGCLAFAIRLPMLVPLTGGIDVDIDEERLDLSCYRGIPADEAWLRLPTTVRMYWDACEDESSPTSTADPPADHLALRTGITAPPGITVRTPGLTSVVTAFVPVITTDPFGQPLTRAGALGPLEAVIWAVGDLVRAARLADDCPPFPDVTLNSLPSQSIPLTYATADEGRLEWKDEIQRYPVDGPASSMTTHRTSPPSAREQQQTRELFADLRIHSPSAIVYDLLRRADAALHAGQPETAVVNYAITCEYLVTNLALSVAWESAADVVDEDVEAAAANLELWKASPHQLLKRCNGIGQGSWEMDTDGVISAWLTNVVDLRNRLVHRGERTTMDHAQLARESAAHLVQLVKERLVKAPGYPKTRAQFTGRPSVEQWASKKRRPSHLQRLGDRETYLEQSEEFRKWRERVYQQDTRRSS